MAKDILMGLRQTYEDFHGVQITEEAVDAAIYLSRRYMLNKHLPDKALDIIDETCARESTMNQKLENDETYKENEEKISQLQKKIEEVAGKRKTIVSTGDRSAKIRTYNYPQSRITDHRIGFTAHNLPAVMNGDLDELLEALRLEEQAERLKAGETHA